MESSRRDFFRKSLKSTLGLSLAPAVFSLENLLPPLKTVRNPKRIPTMRGELSTENFGVTLIHEHLLFGNIPIEKESESIDFTVQMLKDAERVGINTIVDLSPTRDIRLYQKIASQVSVNLIISTGSYIERLIPDVIKNMSAEQYKSHLRQELSKGIQGTDIRAGIIKVAANQTPLTDWEKMVFKAAAEVQQELKVPIATHAIYIRESNSTG